MTKHEQRIIICALQDYAIKCVSLARKTPLYRETWNRYQSTANKLIKELKS